MSASDYIGYVAALCSTSAYAPQVLKAWRTRRTKDISLKAFSVLVVGQCLWLTFGVLKSEWPLVASNVVTLCFTSTILYLKWCEPPDCARAARQPAPMPGE